MLEPNDQIYLTRRELGETLEISSKTIERWQKEGLPAHIWGRRLIRYKLDEVHAWLRTNKGPRATELGADDQRSLS